MNTVHYTKEGINVDATMDGVVIRKYIAGLAGGRALNVEGVTNKVVPVGLPIITDGKSNYKPLYPTEGFVVPAGWSIAGLCGASVLTGKAVSVMNAGVVNEEALLANLKKVCPTPNRVLTLSDLTAIKSALPHIIWEHDEVGDAVITTITGAVYIDSQEDFTAHFDMFADYYKKNPEAEGHDGTWTGFNWVIANYSGLAGTMVIAYNGEVKASVPGITTASTYVIIDPLSDLGVEYASFDLTKLVITVEA